MLRSHFHVGILVLFFSLAAGTQSSAAQPQSLSAGGAARVVATARRATQPPKIDGTLDDLVWQTATPLTDFIQTEPLEGQPASEKTEVRILYDDRFVYIGVICYDTEPSQIIVTDSRRDSSLVDMDSFQMVFDTYHDRQNGFIFGTNPAGTQYDAQVRDEGENQSGGLPVLGRTQTGSGGGINVNWDATWDVKAQITDIGWTAEFSIPLRSLRYGPAPSCGA